jgi:DNA-binding response OmpR family regulator
MMSSKPLILVVDDDADLGRMLSLILGNGGYETQVAHNGSEALAWLADHQPDLVLLDIMMPDMTGFAVLRELRSHETGGQLPVVMITALGDAAAEAESSEAGAQSLLRKPLRPRELLDHIHRLLHPPE